MFLHLTLGLNPCDLPSVASTWQALKAQWILIVRYTDARVVAIYWFLQVRHKVSFNYFETLMVNKFRILGETFLGFSFYG